MQKVETPAGTGAPPRQAVARKELLQVRIPGPVKRRFKAHAAMRGMEPNELFVGMWGHDPRTKPVPQDAPNDADARR